MKHYNQEIRTYIAVDIGGTKIASGLVKIDSNAYSISSHIRIPTDAKSGGADVLRRLVLLIEKQFDIAQMKGIKIDGIGIGTAGVVDSSCGKIIAATDIMPGWAGQDIAKAISNNEKIATLPLYVIGDVGAHGLGEAYFGAGSNYDSVLSVGIGTGIGGAYIDHGILQTGAHGVAGHVGHMIHGLGQGIKCSCGSTAGHIEPVASGTGISTLYNLRLNQRESSDFVQSGAQVVERMNSGDTLAAQVIEESACALGECIGGMANLLDPSVIVVSGSVVNAGSRWWKAIRSGFADSALTLVKATPLVQGSLSDDAPLVGASIAIDHYIQ